MGINRTLQTNPLNALECHTMNTVLWFCLLERCVMQHQSTSVHKRYVIFVSFQMHSLLSFATFFRSSFSFFLEEAAWSCQGLHGDNNLGWRMTPWEWQMKRNQILPGANCMELIQASPHFSPHKQATALTYSNRRSSLSLDTRPVPKSSAGRRNGVRKNWGEENWVIVLLN